MNIAMPRMNTMIANSSLALENGEEDPRSTHQHYTR